jgi:hypothetical protein
MERKKGECIILLNYDSRPSVQGDKLLMLMSLNIIPVDANSISLIYLARGVLCIQIAFFLFYHLFYIIGKSDITIKDHPPFIDVISGRGVTSNLY